MTYVDGFVVPVPKRKVAAYKKIATLAGKVWMEYGALAYLEAVARDKVNAKVMKDKRLNGMDMKNMPFDGKRLIFGGFKAIVQK